MRRHIICVLLDVLEVAADVLCIKVLASLGTDLGETLVLEERKAEYLRSEGKVEHYARSCKATRYAMPIH